MIEVYYSKICLEALFYVKDNSFNWSDYFFDKWEKIDADFDFSDDVKIFELTE